MALPKKPKKKKKEYEPVKLTPSQQKKNMIIENGLGDCISDELEDIIDQLTLKDIRQCSQYETCEAFVSCLVRRIADRDIRKRQLAKNPKIKD